MFDIAVFFALAYMSFRVIRALREEASIRAEFKQGSKLIFLVALLPVGPIALLTTALLAPFPVPHALAAACFIPALVCSRQQAHALETAGTDRVQHLRSATSEAFGASLAGLAYLLTSFAISFGAKAVAQ